MARPKKIAVVDASVVVKWFNMEDYTPDALRLLNDYFDNRLELLAPYLLVYEVGNALRYNSDFGESDVKESLSYLRDLQLSLRLTDEEDANKAVSIAFRLGLTLYDSTYLALAEKEDCNLYTADEKSLAKMSRNPKVSHIREYRAST